MNSRLNSIMDWPERARAAGYRLTKLAANCGVSPRQMRRFIREISDMAPRLWLRAMRISRGRLQLARGQSVKGIATDLGYARPEHFSRAFKQFEGVPPSHCPRATAP